eukprot:COSAG06_NODE_1090_length_10746_cov_5.415892_2_plen_204_part_00
MMIVLLRQTRDEHKGNWSLREILPQESGPVPVDKADSQVEKAEPGGGQAPGSAAASAAGQRRPQHAAPAVLDQSVEAAAVRPAASDVAVQDISGTKHVLRVIDTWATTVSELKRELQQRSGIPPDAQRLLLNQQTLEDETKCLQAYGVQPGCTISLTLQDEAACAARREARLEKRVQDEARSDGDDVPMVGSDCTPAPKQPQL